MWMSREWGTFLTGPPSKRCLLKMLEIWYFLIAQTYSCRSLRLSCSGQPHGCLLVEKPWVAQSCQERLSWDGEADFLNKKPRCPKALLMPSSRTASLHYRNPFISLISVGARTRYEISLQLWWNKFNWDQTYFYFLCDYILNQSA